MSDMIHAEPDADNFGGQSDHDFDNVAEDIQNIAQALSLLVDKVDAMDKMYDALNDHVDKLDKLINDDFIGGITQLYEDNDREIGMKGLQDKYGESVSPYMDAIHALNPDFDVWGSMYKSLKGLKSQPGYTDEMGDAHIKAILDELTGKFGSIQDALSKAKPVAAVKVTKVEGGPVEEEGSEEEEAPEVSARQKELAKMASALGKREAKGMKK